MEQESNFATSILSPDEFEKLKDMRRIQEFAKFIQDRLNQILWPQQLIWWDKTPGQTDTAESDRDQEKTRLDGFIISAAFAKQQIGEEEYICGNPAHESLYQEMALIQATIEDTKWDDKIAENHLSFMTPAVGRYHKNPLCVKSALATKAGVFLAVGYFNLPLDISDTAEAKFLPWNEAHGIERTKTFFCQWPAASVLFDVLESTGLQLTLEAVRCLGSGNLGSVFPVRAHADSQQMALKVVVGAGKAFKLRNEFEINQQVAAAAPHAAVVKATRFAMAAIVSGGAGMLMEEVGEPVAPKDHRNLARALHALSDLHRAGFTHGSARLDNLVECGGRLKWCDLQRAKRMCGRLSTEKPLRHDFLVTLPGHEILRDVTALVDSWGCASMSRMINPAVIAYVAGHWSVDAALEILCMSMDEDAEEERDSAACI